MIRPWLNARSSATSSAINRRNDSVRRNRVPVQADSRSQRLDEQRALILPSNAALKALLRPYGEIRYVIGGPIRTDDSWNSRLRLHAGVHCASAPRSYRTARRPLRSGGFCGG